MQSSNPFRRKLVGEDQNHRSAQEELSIISDDSVFTRVPEGVLRFSPPPEAPQITIIPGSIPSTPTTSSPTAPQSSVEAPIKVSSRRRPAPPPPPTRTQSIRASTVKNTSQPRPADPFETGPETDDQDVTSTLQTLSRSSSTKLNPFRRSEDLADPGQPNRKSLDINNIRFGTGHAAMQSPSSPQSIDVDAFKRLILTGNAGATDNSLDVSQKHSGSAVTEPAPEATTDLKVPLHEDFTKIDAPAAPLASAEKPEKGIEEVTLESAPNHEAGAGANGGNQKPKPPPPRPRSRKTGSSLSVSSSSASITPQNPTPKPATQALDRPVSPPSTEPSPQISEADLTPSQIPLPTSPLQIHKKPVPPSPPLSRKHSTRNSRIIPLASSLTPISGKSKPISGALPPPPPPPPSRRINSSLSGESRARPQSMIVLGTSLGENSLTPSKGGLPPPPPPRGTRRRVSDGNKKDGAVGGIESTGPGAGGAGGSRSTEDQNRDSEALKVGEEAVGEEALKAEKDLLADLEKLQREVDALKGMVERKNSEDIA